MSFAPASSARAAGPQTVCLFTDFGWDDPYVAQLKGVIITLAPNVRLVDLNHSITSYTSPKAAICSTNARRNFPPAPSSSPWSIRRSAPSATRS